MKNLPIKSASFRYLEKSFGEWLDILGYSAPTVYKLPIHIRELFHWLEQEGYSQIDQLTTSQYKQYYSYLKERGNQRKQGTLSNGHLNKHLQALYKFMDYLRQSGRKELPVLRIRREELETEEITVLSVEEIKSLFKATKMHPNGSLWEAIAARDRAMLTVFYSCGLRRTEGAKLDLQDIHWERKLLHVRKGKNYKERMVPFHQKSLQTLQTYVYDHRPIFLNSKQCDALFMGVKGKRMQGQSLYIRLKLLQQRSENIHLQQKDFALHSLRHSIATHLLQNGMPLDQISRFLGHSSLESTQIYTHLIEESKQNGKDI